MLFTIIICIIAFCIALAIVLFIDNVVKKLAEKDGFIAFIAEQILYADSYSQWAWTLVALITLAIAYGIDSLFH